MNLSELKEKVDERKHRKVFLEDSIKQKQDSIETKQYKYDTLATVREVLAKASQLTQVQVKHKIEALVTMALQGVYEDKNMRFIAKFEIKRNKSECFFLVQEGDKEPYIPKDDKGGGILDVIGFALRVVLWSMQNPRSRNVFILDEPGKWTGQLSKKFGAMIKEISKKLDMQIIMITHDNALMEIADKSWTVTQEDGISYVIENN